MKYKKKGGFIFFTVVIITLLITSVTLTVLTINSSHAKDIVNDAQRNNAYYVAYAGLEIVYAALNDKSYEGTSGGRSAIEVAEYTLSSDGKNMIRFGTQVFEKKEKIVAERDISIKLPSDGTEVAHAQIYGDLLIREKDPYFRIVSTGYIFVNDDENLPADTHTLTMFVFKSDPNNPKIYSGNRAKF